jgi:hypothetical protein
MAPRLHSLNTIAGASTTTLDHSIEHEPSTSIRRVYLLRISSERASRRQASLNGGVYRPDEGAQNRHLSRINIDAPGDPDLGEERE